MTPQPPVQPATGRRGRRDRRGQVPLRLEVEAEHGEDRMTRWDLVAMLSVFYLGLEIGWLRSRVRKLEAQTERLRKTLDNAGIYL